MTYDDTLETFEAFDTEILPALDDATDTQIDLRAVPLDVVGDLEPIEVERLEDVSGGMRWEQFRRSTNVEDRRGPRAIARDDAWFKQTSAPPPLPPARPADLGAPVPLPPRRPDGL